MYRVCSHGDDTPVQAYDLGASEQLTLDKGSIVGDNTRLSDGLRPRAGQVR